MNVGLRELCLTALCAAILVGCRDSGEPPIVAEEVLQLNERADKVGFGVEHHVTSQGIRRATVVADTAYFIEQEGIVELRQMQVTFYGESGEVTSILTAREGVYDWNSGDMTAETDVLVINPEEGRRIETSILQYDASDDRIWSDAPTAMTEADGTVVEGTAFRSDSSMDDIEITSARMVRPGSQPEPESRP